MPDRNRRGIMGSILDKFFSLVHKRADNSLHRYENHRVGTEHRRRLRDRSRDSPRRPPERDWDRGRDRDLYFGYDSSLSFTWSPPVSPTEPFLTHPKRYIDDRYCASYRETYPNRGRGWESQEPERESTHRPHAPYASPGSRVPLPPAGLQDERNWLLNPQPLPNTPVPHRHAEDEVERNWPAAPETIQSGAIAWELASISSQPGQQDSNNGDNNSDIRIHIADDEDANLSTNRDGKTGWGSNPESDSDSNISLDEWEDPEEYQRRLAAKNTEQEKRQGRVLQPKTVESGACSSTQPISLPQGREQTQNPTARSWLEEVMTSNHSISNASGEDMHKEETVSSDTEIPTEEQVREGKRPEKPVHPGQIIVSEYHASPVAQNHSIRRKPAGSAPSRKMATGSNTESKLSESVNNPGTASAHGESSQVIPERSQIPQVTNEGLHYHHLPLYHSQSHALTYAIYEFNNEPRSTHSGNATPVIPHNFSYPLKRDNSGAQPQPQPPSEEKRRPGLNVAGPESSKTPVDDSRHMEQPGYSYVWDRCDDWTGFPGIRTRRRRSV